MNEIMINFCDPNERCCSRCAKRRAYTLSFR
jgi:hypothetical protein